MLRILPEIVEPELWTLAFQRTPIYWWQRLLPGPFKHVLAIAYVEPLALWVVYDLWLQRTRIQLIPDRADATLRLGAMTADCELVRMRRKEGRGILLALFSCVSAVSHLVGCKCVALTPSGLYRWCLKNGGESLERTEDGHEPGRGDCAAEGASPEGSH